MLTVAAAVGVATVGFGEPAHAVTTITVSPATDLSDNQTVTVTVSGFADGAGGITECNTATGQPTIAVANNPIPVSCSNPLNNLQNATGGGFVGKPFTRAPWVHLRREPTAPARTRRPTPPSIPARPRL